MPLPKTASERAMKDGREDRLTVGELIEQLQDLPDYYPTDVREVLVEAPEGGYRTVRFGR